ncbi:MAG: aminopeptidase P family N-terminal domain-containing protein [Acidimicrobiales bacterium]
MCLTDLVASSRFVSTITTCSLLRSRRSHETASVPGPDSGCCSVGSTELGLDQLVVSSRPNIRWLTGFAGSNGTVLITSDRLVLATDGRYEEHAQECLDQLAACGYTGGELLVVRRDVVRRSLGVAPPDGFVGFR